MTTETEVRKCRSKTKFGMCGLPQHPDRFHAVPVGDGVWYAYHGNGLSAEAVGYGKFVDGEWVNL